MSSLREAMIMNSRYRGSMYIEDGFICLSYRHCKGIWHLIDRKAMLIHVDKANRPHPIFMRLNYLSTPVPKAEINNAATHTPIPISQSHISFPV